MSDDRPSVYAEDGKIIYRASGFGNCDKELVAIRCGFVPAPFPSRFTKIFADGHRGEDVIIGMLEEEGWFIGRRQEEINWEVLPNVFIRGHIDGVADHMGKKIGPAIFDAKTTSARYGISAALHKKYELQLSIYGHALGFDAAVLGVGEKDPDSGDVVSVTMQDWSTLPVSRGSIIARVHKLESYAKHYMETGDYPTCDEKQYPCGAFQLHHGKAGEDGDDPYGGYFTPVLEDDSLDTLAAMYLDAMQAEAKAKDDKANARKLILAHVGGPENRTTDSHQIAWTGSGTSTSLNKDRLSKYLKGLGPGAPAIEDFMDTKTAEKRISVKPIGDEK